MYLKKRPNSKEDDDMSSAMLCGFCNKWSLTVIILKSHILGKDHPILVNLSSHFNLYSANMRSAFGNNYV